MYEIGESPLSGAELTSKSSGRRSANDPKLTFLATRSMSATDPNTDMRNVRQAAIVGRRSLPEIVGSMEGSGRIERTDGDVVPVRISERKFHGSSVGIHMWLFFQQADESARPWQSYVKVVDPEEQEEAVTRLGVVGACQRRMLVGTPLVETEQDRSIRVED
jgi:DNA-directed RNA polymerase subunit N (RpoN/RPB10)